MYTDDAKLIAKMTPHLKRVLIVDPHSASARLIGDVMRSLTGAQIWIAPSARKGLAMTQEVDAQIIFVERSGPDTDGTEFTRRLRRSDVACRQAPVIMVTAEATAQSIIDARDAGVSEFLRKPFTTKDLLRRLAAVTLHPRDWIEAVAYIGPDRRRFNSGDYSGPLKRRTDKRQTPDKARINQALRIVKSAVGAVERDREQALRAMSAQAADLKQASMAIGDIALVTATADFQRYLTAVVAETAPFTCAEAARQTAGLLAFLPDDPPVKDRSAAA